MTDPSTGRTWRYRFSRPGDIEIELSELVDDAAAAAHARELSKSEDAAVIIQRHDHVDWQYVTEVDERR